MAFARKSYSLSFIVLIITFTLIMLIAQRGDPIVVKTNLENIPLQVGSYHGTEDRFPDSVYEELGADLHLYRHYRNMNGTVISLYIGYYGTAKGGRTGHNPLACLPGAGWGIIKTGKVSLAKMKEQVTVNAIIAQKGNAYQTVMYWYQSDKDRILNNGIQQNIQRFVSRISHNRNDGAFVQLSMLTPNNDFEQAEKHLKRFGEKVLAVLSDYWPEEQ